MQELLDVEMADWNIKQKELSLIASELQIRTQYEYAKSIKIIPSFDGNSSWLSPWEIMDHQSITKDQKLGYFKTSQDV